MDVNPGPETEATDDPSVARGFVQLPPRQLRLAVLGVLSSLFLAILNQTIVATAMPRIVADLGGFDRYTWTLTAYLVASTVAIPIAGRLSDIYGRRVFLILGLAAFTVCSIPAGLSQTMNQLVASRALQGIGGGIIMASCFTAGADLFPPRKRGGFQALSGLAFGIAAVIGPVLGGFITDHFTWHWIFLLNVPIGLVVLVIVPAFPKIRPEVEDRRLDYPGMATLALAVVSILVGLSWGHGVSAPAVGLLVFGVAMAVVFVAIEAKSAYPIMPLEIYRHPTVAVSAVVVLLTGLGLYGGILFTPLFFQEVLDTSAAGSGSVLIPMVFGVVIGAVLSGQLIARTGGRYRAQGIVSTGLLAAGMYLLSTMNEDTSLTRGMSYVFVAAIGAGGTMSTFRLAVQNSVPFRLVGTATAALQFFRLVSGTVGLAVLGAVLTRSLATRLDATLPESVKAALPPGRLDAIKNDPQALVDPVAADTLKAGLTEALPDGAGMAGTLLAALNSALAGAVGDVFAVSAVVVLLSVIAAVFLNPPAHARRAMQPTERAERMDPATRSWVLRHGLAAFCALAVLVLGAVGMRVLVGLREPPQRQVVEHPGPLVRVLSIQPQNVSVTVKGFGTVQAKHVWSVVPEVSGPITRLAPNLRAGMQVRQGDLLFEVDPQPYRLAVQRIGARVQQYEKEIAVLTQQRQNHINTLALARNDLAIAEEDLRRDEELARRGAISTRERNRRRQIRNEVMRAVQNAEHLLALSGPQIEQAEAAIAVARADLEAAELQLSKTRLLAPFDGQVMNSTVDLGEFVSAGREVAALYGAEAVEIPIAVPLDELRWLPMLSPAHFSPPSPADPQPGTPLPAAAVHWQNGGQDYTWRGEVVRWEAGLDAATRTMTLVIEVREPWASFRPGEHPALQPGMFCRVDITASEIPDAVVIPRTALHDGNTVFLAEDGRLAQRQVQVARFRHDEAILSAGLQPGDKLVVSVLSAPVVGMKLRALETEPRPPDPAAVATERLSSGQEAR